MYQQGIFICAICEDRMHKSKEKEVHRSFFPERTIPVCEHCYNDWRTAPEYEHLRPDVDPNDKKKIEKAREYYSDVHIFF